MSLLSCLPSLSIMLFMKNSRLMCQAAIHLKVVPHFFPMEYKLYITNDLLSFIFTSCVCLHYKLFWFLEKITKLYMYLGSFIIHFLQAVFVFHCKLFWFLENFLLTCNDHPSIHPFHVKHYFFLHCACADLQDVAVAITPSMPISLTQIQVVRR